MAEDDGEPRPETLPPSPLITWERSHIPSLSDQLHYQSKSPLLSDPHGDGDQWTSTVFPPNNHEGLNLHHHNDDDLETHKDQRPTPSSPVSGGLKPAAMGAVKWWISHLKLSGGIFSWIWNFSVIRGGLLRLFNLPLVGSMVLLVLFHLRFRRRRRFRREAVDELLGVIKEKDERMHQLLYQIARMNELLLATHHGVPMISKAESS